MCPHCGLDLTTPEIQNVWQALTVADQWVEHARARQHAVAAGTGATVPRTTGIPAPGTEAAPQAVPPTPAAPRRSVSAGAVLLGLGAVCILVAGTIFITVSWGSLGVAGRAAVLLAVTVLIGVLGWFVTRRGLRGSSEAVWSVFFGLVTLDWFAARAEGLLGLDAWPFGVAAAVWGAVVIGTGLLVVAEGRRRLGRELLAPSIIGGGSAWIAAGSLAAELAGHVSGEFWPGVLAASVAAAAWVVMRRGSMRVGALLALAGLVVYAVFAVFAALVEATDHAALHELVVDAHGLPLILVVLASVAVGVVMPSARWGASAVAVAGSATLICLPIEEAWPGRGGYVSVASLVVVGALVFVGRGDWSRGARLSVGLGTLGLAVAALPWVAQLLAVAAAGAAGPRADDLSTRLRPEDFFEAGPWWLVLVAGAAIAVVVVVAARWPESTPVRGHLAPVAWTVAVSALLAAEAATFPPAVSLGTSIVAAGAVLFFVLRDRHVAWTWVGPALVAAAPLASLSSWPATAVVWPLAGIALAAVAVLVEHVVLRAAATFAATGWGLGTTAVVLEVLEVDDRWIGLGLVAAAVLGLAVGLFAVRDLWAHRASEVAAAILGVGGLTIAGIESTVAFSALVWTVAGAGVVVLGLASTRRRWYRWVGSGLLGVAYVLRLAASDVDVVEAYTAPFAAVLLATGLWAMRDRSGPGSVQALLPGLVLAMLPSLPQALDDPAGLRALLLGVGSVVALVVGISRRWKAPLVAGAVVLAVLALANVAPVAVAVPRWVLLASAGVLLGGAGITWENRVRDGRAAIRYVGAMR